MSIILLPLPRLKIGKKATGNKSILPALVSVAKYWFSILVMRRGGKTLEPLDSVSSNLPLRFLV